MPQRSAESEWYYFWQRLRVWSRSLIVYSVRNIMGLIAQSRPGVFVRSPMGAKALDGCGAVFVKLAHAIE